MTSDEIQALREKHRLDEFECSCCWCYEITNDLLPVPYPCDVILMLDELDRVLQRIIDRCDHLIHDPITGKPTPAYEWGHIFCPKCGVKL